MMDTLLNVGLDASTEQEWVKRVGLPCYMNSRHRLIQMYGSVVMGMDEQVLKHTPDRQKQKPLTSWSQGSSPMLTASYLVPLKRYSSRGTMNVLRSTVS